MEKVKLGDPQLIPLEKPIHASKLLTLLTMFIKCKKKSIDVD